MEYAGARRPDRHRTVESNGVRIAVSEWGDPGARPLLLAHGGFDFAGTFDVFAPLLADGGWRVVSWDQRGHGDSEHTLLYSWNSDQRDVVAVMDSVTRDPLPIVGHSKGGAMSLQIAEALPHRVSHLVNIDGLPSPRSHPDVAAHERTQLLANELEHWLDHRRGTATAQRKADTVEGLARRRARMNPRLEFDWLCYLVTIGGREDADGWRWKIDPTLRMGGFGPHRNEWELERLASIAAPMIGFLGLQPEVMGWGTAPGELDYYLPRGARLHLFEDAGHFVHIEKPHKVAELALEFLS